MRGCVANGWGGWCAWRAHVSRMPALVFCTALHQWTLSGWQSNLPARARVTYAAQLGGSGAGRGGGDLSTAMRNPSREGMPAVSSSWRHSALMCEMLRL